MTKKTLVVAIVFALLLIVGSISTAAMRDIQLDPTLRAYLPVVSRIDPPKWIGPDGGSIVCLAISPSYPNVIYAGTWGAGVYKTTNSGESWTPVNAGLPVLEINALAVDPQNPNVAYAGPYKQGLFKTVNGGASWFWVSSGLQAEANVYAIGVDPVVTSRLYIGTRGVAVKIEDPDIYRWNGVVYKSSDGGGSWKSVLANAGGTDFQDWAYDIAIHPYATNLVMLAMHEYGVRRSTDYGDSFDSIYSGLIMEENPPHPGLSGRAIVFNQSPSPDLAYYGVWHGAGAFRSTDAGQNWQHIGLNGTKVYQMAVDPGSPNTAYAATWNNNGVLKTIDSGDHWNPAGDLSQNQLYTVEVNPNASNTVFVGTLGDGLYWSTNGGSSWSHRQNGIWNTSVNSVLVQPDAAKTVYTSTFGGGVSRLPDPEGNWQEFNQGLPEKGLYGLVRSPSNPDLLYALTSKSGLYWRDTSTSSNWTSTGSGLPAADPLAAPLYSPDHPFASREDVEAEVETVPEAAYDISLPEATTATTSLLTMTFAPSNSNIAYLGTANAGVYSRSDGEVNWVAKGLSSHAVWSIAVSPQNSLILYAAARLVTNPVSPQPDIVYYSINGGMSWVETFLPRPVVYTVYFSPQDAQRVYTGTDNGVYKQVSGGAWTQSGLAGKAVTMLAAHPSRANTLLAGTTSGVYITNDNGQTWQPILPELINYTIQSIAFDPENEHMTYFGTTTNGVSLAYVP
jgi:photosystem II stability/assembly factor-like uncharacterized protein